MNRYKYLFYSLLLYVQYARAHQLARSIYSTVLFYYDCWTACVHEAVIGFFLVHSLNTTSTNSPLSSAFRVSCSWRHVLCCVVFIFLYYVKYPIAHSPSLHTLLYISFFLSASPCFSPSSIHSIRFIHSVSGRLWFFALILFFLVLFWYVCIFVICFLCVFFGVHWHCTRYIATRVK